MKFQLPLHWTDRRFTLDVLPAGNDRSEVAEISVTETSRPEEKRLVSLHLPREAHVMLVTRGREHLVPRGSTRLAAGDVLSVLADPLALEKVRSVIASAHPANLRP